MPSAYRQSGDRDHRLKRTVNTTLVAFVVAALAAGYALGLSRDGEPARQVSDTAPAVPDAAPAVPETAPAAPAAVAGMDQPGFWELIATTRGAAGNDTGRQSELLEERLSELPAQQIAEFGRIRHQVDQQAYTWDIWGAAYVIEDGCSDDCFRDFRAYLISLGSRAYEAALRDPDALAPVVQDAEEGDWENADNVAPDAYESATGEDIPSGDSDLSGNPRGAPWDDESQDELVQRYPQLAARFR
jgi:hypothetical protein